MNDVIMSDADCTPGREPRSVAASNTLVFVLLLLLVVLMVMLLILQSGLDHVEPTQSDGRATAVFSYTRPPQREFLVD